eukprot:365733-Chlamydomonas_euryale.AAC.10
MNESCVRRWGRQRSYRAFRHPDVPSWRIPAARHAACHLDRTTPNKGFVLSQIDGKRVHTGLSRRCALRGPGAVLGAIHCGLAPCPASPHRSRCLSGRAAAAASCHKAATCVLATGRSRRAGQGAFGNVAAMGPVAAYDGADARAALYAELQAIDCALLQAHAEFVDDACLARYLRARKGNVGWVWALL